MTAQVSLTKNLSVKTSVIWTEETQLEVFAYKAKCHIQGNLNRAYHYKYLIPAVEHGGGGVMI